MERDADEPTGTGFGLPAAPSPATGPAVPATPGRRPEVTAPVRPLPAVPPAVFYEVAQADLEGRPGSIIDALELAAPAGVRGWAVLYRSTGRDGASVPVSGLVLAPDDGGDGGEDGGGRPVVAWAHGTTGLADGCAPSLAGLAGGDVGGLVDLVRGGVVVTATDYEGLGTAGLHPYLVGVSEGRSILDAIRAAAGLPETGAGRRSVVVGISQGGHAALWAGELVDAYAPELDVAGVVAASPPIDLRAVKRAVLSEAGDGMTWLESLMVAAAWRDVFDLQLEGFLTPEAQRITAALTERCPWEIEPPSRTPFLVDPEDVPAWQQLLEANSPGRAPSRPPILVLAARDDELIPASTIPAGVRRLCAAGSRVELRWVDGPHAATVTDPTATAWITEWVFGRLAGIPAIDGCG